MFVRDGKLRRGSTLCLRSRELHIGGSVGRFYIYFSPGSHITTASEDTVNKDTLLMQGSCEIFKKA